jgi:glycosyltransferase involved in cell wall biosynthesis
MKVSIIIPVYNVQEYITRCMDSVCQQTFQDIECILVDDCGKDNSVKLAEDYIQRYTGAVRFVMLHHEHNKGLSGARNTGIKAATGDFLYFLDSDDFITPDCIETLVQLAEKYPQADFVQGNILGNDDQMSSYAFEDTVPEYCDNKEELMHLMLHEVITSAWNRLIRRSFLLEHELFFPEGIIHEDMYWTYFLTKYTKAAAYCTKGVYHYFIHEGSIMTSVSKEMMKKRLSSRVWSNERFLEDAKRNGASQFQRQYITLNLLCCLVELNALKSLSEWLPFWAKVVSFGFSHITHFTLSRYIIYCCLLPPACFFAGKDNFRWRIQQEFVCNV